MDFDVSFLLLLTHKHGGPDAVLAGQVQLFHQPLNLPHKASPGLGHCQNRHQGATASRDWAAEPHWAT